jgi:hypothetical protein
MPSRCELQLHSLGDMYPTEQPLQQSHRPDRRQIGQWRRIADDPIHDPA